MQGTTKDNVCSNSFKVIGPVDAARGDKFPGSLATFDLPAQYKGCTYSGSSSSVGSVNCGDKTFSCGEKKDVSYDCGVTWEDGASTKVTHVYNEVIECEITY
jgi:hypothetical protein